MKRFALFFLISISAIAGTRDNFNRTNGALGDKWIAAPGQTSGTGMTIVSNAIIPSNVLGVNSLAFSVFDSLITNVDSLRIGFTLNHLSTDAAGSWNEISAQFSFLSTKSVASNGGARGWKLAFHASHISIVFARDSVDEYQAIENTSGATLAAGDTLYLEIRYGGDSCYVYRNSETTPLCKAGDVAWNIIQLSSGGYVHVGAMVQNNQSILDNFIIGQATVAVVTPPSTLNSAPVVQSYEHVPTIADTSSLVYITTRVTDDYKLDSITVYVEGTPNSGTYTAKKAIKTLSLGTKDTTISTLSTAAKYSIGAHRYFVRAKDDSGAVTISPTKSFTVGISSSLWRTAYYATWSYGDNSANYSCPPWDIDMTGLTHIVLFDNGNVTQSAPYWAYMFGPPGDTVKTPRPADCESDSVSIEFNGVSDPRDGRWPKYLDSLITIAHRNNVKVVITIQAVAKTAPNLSYVTADSARCQLFVNTLVSWAERKKFDGVEIDWEGWAEGYSMPDSVQIDRFVRILYRRVHTMQTVSGQPGEIQISAGSSYQNYYSPSQDYMVNQFNLQLYDYSYAWYDQPIMMNAAWHISPLYRGSGLPTAFQGMSWDTRGPLQWIAAGHDRKRIGVGFPTFGWILKNVDTLLAPMTSGGDYGQANYQVIEALKTNGGREVWDDVRKVRYIKGTALNTIGTAGWGKDGVTAGQKFLATSENAQSLAEKVAWVKANGLGGFMIYDHISDYDRSQPRGSSLRRPLQYALFNALGAVTTPVYPSVPTLSLPNNGATGYPITGVGFQWRSAANATKYEIEVSSSSTFGTIVYSNSNVTDTTVTAVISPSLGYVTPYYWHVRGVNSNGTSSWSSAYSFTTVSQFTSAPATPTLVTPAAGATNQEIALTLSWSANDAITTSYQYQYGYDTVSSTKQILNAGSSVALTGLAYSTPYFFHVRAVNSYGSSAWTSWRTFTTKAAPVVITGTLDVIPVTYNGTTGKVQNSAQAYMTLQDADSSNIPYPTAGKVNISKSGVRFSDGSFKAFGGSTGATLTPDQIMTQIGLASTTIPGARIQTVTATQPGAVPSPASAKSKILKTDAITGIPAWADEATGYVNRSEIYTIGQPLALDSSMIVAARIFPMMIGNNEIVDTLYVFASGSCSFTANLYCAQSSFTAADSLLSGIGTFTPSNTKAAKVTSDMRNSGSLGTRIWWFKITTVTTKPDAVVVQLKGHRP